MFVRVGGFDVDPQSVVAVRKEEVDLPSRLEGSIELVESQERAAGGIDDAGENRFTGQEAVPVERAVPLDPAGKPGVADGEVRELQDRVVEEQLAAGPLVE